MAKRKDEIIEKKALTKKEDVEEIVVDSDEEVLIDNTDEVKIEVAEKEVKPNKMVKVRLSQDHRCHIGGEWYVFYEGKQYNVPENVKDILNMNNLLKPI